MKFVNRIAGVAALGAAMLIGCGLSAPSARAGYMVTLLQDGLNVVATGSGSIDLAGLTRVGTGDLGSAFIDPSLGQIDTGPVPAVPTTVYTGFTGPSRFGSGNGTTGSTGSGDPVSIVGLFGSLSVPRGYVSGNHLSDSVTYDNQTFAMLGVTPGTYVWTWGSGADQRFTLQIGPAAVPEPSSLALLALPLGLAIVLAAQPRRITRSARLT